MKQHLNIKKFYGQSEQAVHNQVYIAMIVYCLNILDQLNTNSSRTYLQISRWLKAALWKPAHTWIRKIKGSAGFQGLIISVPLVKGYSEKMNVYYFCCVFVFLLKRKINGSENLVKIYATVVEEGIYFLKVRSP